MERIGMLFASTICAAAVFASGGNDGAGRRETLQFLTNSADCVPAFLAVNDLFEKRNPGYRVELTSIPGVAEFNTAMASKIAAGEVPDLFYYQWSTQVQLYAKEGHLMDLTPSKLIDRYREVKKPVHTYRGRVYALPIGQSSWGVFVNWDACNKYGVDYMPKTFQQWQDAMAVMKKNGLESPIVIPAKDGSGAAAFVFGYLHLMVSGKNPDWYKEILEGRKSWNGPEIARLLDDYAKILRFANKDLLALNPEGARQRFAKGEAAYFINGNWAIADFRKLNPNMNCTLDVFPFGDRPDDMTAIFDFESAVSVSSKTKYPQAALAYLDLLSTAESGDLFAQKTLMASAVKGSKVLYDKWLQPQVPLLNEGRSVGFSEREWIPGFKEILKKTVQDWIAGKPTGESLDQLESEHQRLLKAKPDFYTDFLDTRGVRKL